MKVKGHFEGHCRNFVDAIWREALAVAPRAPPSLMIYVHERVAAPQKSSHIERMLRPRSTRRACNPALGKVGGRFQICMDMLSST